MFEKKLRERHKSKYVLFIIGTIPFDRERYEFFSIRVPWSTVKGSTMEPETTHIFLHYLREVECKKVMLLNRRRVTAKQECCRNVEIPELLVGSAESKKRPLNGILQLFCDTT